MKTLLLTLGILLSSSQAYCYYFEYVCGTTDGAHKYFERGYQKHTREEVMAAVSKKCLKNNPKHKPCVRPICKKVKQPSNVSEIPGYRPPSHSSDSSNRDENSSHSSAPEPQATPPPVFRQCSSDAQCQGFADHCFAGRCTAPGYSCSGDGDCPGFGNHCFASKCTRQEPLCDNDSQCPGFANHCFAGKCTNP